MNFLERDKQEQLLSLLNRIRVALYLSQTALHTNVPFNEDDNSYRNFAADLAYSAATAVVDSSTSDFDQLLKLLGVEDSSLPICAYDFPALARLVSLD